MEQLLTGEDVARILKVSKAFAYRLMQRGDITTVRLGRSVRVRPTDLQHFIEESTCSSQRYFAVQLQ
jgi:excisionase family DNA binding protein